MTAASGRGHAVGLGFFARPTLEVARSLIGCTLARGRCSGRIVEAEAYTDDEASHFVTRAPSAGQLMGVTHGCIYVYSIYGMHLCLNVTTDALGPGAVLLRALEPTGGLELMRRRRGGVADRDLCRGPGRLAQALGVTRRLNSRPFLDEFGLALPETPADVVTSARVGISRAVAHPWRFSERGSPFVSAPLPRRLDTRKPGA